MFFSGVANGKLPSFKYLPSPHMLVQAALIKSVEEEDQRGQGKRK